MAASLRHKKYFVFLCRFFVSFFVSSFWTSHSSHPHTVFFELRSIGSDIYNLWRLFWIAAERDCIHRRFKLVNIDFFKD
ncbi:hypothetical protein TNIN_437961 [Trichonephila inaurata madagascariensis]|uniref:Uncharacterized protein n=1 Tax=Trichonephila inaurata madagascariensis TaxID=2747483 RepID=A0A8X6XE11_9ARAC|nr:hypothetical protein TNIN_437961 [Trichonephila inaurata madagascariensis]